MKKLLSILLVLLSVTGYSQQRPLLFVADTTRFYSNSGNGATLKLENFTKNIKGFLYNIGGGVTEFRHGAVRISPSQVVIGNDTMDIPTSGTIINPSPGIDSLNFTFTGFCAWAAGESFCSDFRLFPIGGHLSADSSEYIFVNSNNDSIFALPTLVKHLFAGPNISLTERGDSVIISGTAGINNGNGLLSGGIVSWSGVGYVYNVTSAIYVIGNIQYTSAAGTITLDPSDATLNRKDVITLDNTGAIVKLTGDAASLPTTPHPDPATQLQLPLTVVDVDAATTVPSGVTQKILYDEQTSGEAAITATSGLSVNAGDITTPFHLTKDINVGTWTTTKNIVFTNATVLNRNDYTLLKLYINLKAVISSTANVQVFFQNGSTTLTPAITLGAAQGFDKTIIGYQNITIPLSSIAFSGVNFDRVIVRVIGAGNGFYLDYVQLQGGITNSGATYSVKAPLTFDGNVFGLDTTSGKASAAVTQYQRTKTKDSLAALIDLKENALGNPSTNGWVLSSLTNGTRSWIAPGSGGGSGVSKAYAPLLVNTAGDSISLNFNVKRFGAWGDGIHNDTRAIIATVNAAHAAGGGIVFFPTGIYNVADTIIPSCKCQIPIPTTTFADPARNQITFMGETRPSMNPVGGGISGPSLAPTITSGVIIKSTLSTGSVAGAFVIAANASALNHAYLSLVNIVIQVKNNPSGTGPIIGGASMKWGASLSTDYSIATVDTSGQATTYPGNDVAGFETPDNGSEEYNSITNSLSIGFRKGISISEHTVLNNFFSWCSYYGQYYKGGSNSNASIMSGSYWCANDIYITGGTTSLFANYNFQSAWQQAGKWYDAIATVKDSAGLGRGQIFYSFDGGADNRFTKSGGSSLHCLPMTDGVAAYAQGMAIGNTVVNGTISSIPYFGTAGILAQDSSRLKWDATNKRLMVGSGVPSFDLEVASSAPFIRVNHVGSNNTSGVLFSDGPNNKWGFFNSVAGAGTYDFGIHDYVNNKRRLYFGTAGTVNIGGNADAAATAAIAIDNSLNVGFDNNNVKVDAVNHLLITPKLVGTTGTTTGLTLQATTGIGTTGANIDFKVGNNGSLTPLSILNDGTITATSNSANAFNLTGSNSGRVSYTAQNTNSAGNTSFYFQNDRGSFNAYGGAGQGGSAFGGSWFGLSRSDATFIIADGANSTGLLMGTLQAQPVTIGTNNTARITFSSGGLIGIGTASPAASSKLEISSTTQGFLPPRMTKTQRDAISSPASGLVIYQTDNTPGIRVYNGTNWMKYTETAD